MPAAHPDDRDETTEQRDDRNLIELLQELRVAGLGVQVLFGFLLALPFSSRFDQLSHPQRGLYTAILVVSALATALLLGPVAYHRLMFRLGQKERLVRAANAMAIGGLAAVALAVSGTVWLVVSFVVKGVGVYIIGGCVAVAFASLWFAFPLASRAATRRRP
jgi:MFS family permease